VVDVSEIYRYVTELKLDLLDAAFAYHGAVNDQSVELVVNALYKQEKSNHLHVFLFTPYSQVFDIRNDPVNILYKATLLKHLKKTDVRRLTLHWFVSSLRENLQHIPLTYESYVQEEIDYVASLLKLMKTGASYPLVPCKHNNCQFRRTCFPFEA